MANYNNNYNRGYNNNYRNNNNYKQRTQKKHSGASFGYAHGDQEKPYIRGWKFDRRNGLRSFIASPYKGTKRIRSKSGREWENWVVKITLSNGQQILKSGLYDVANRKVIIKDLGFVMNPKAKNGGYTGTFIQK